MGASGSRRNLQIQIRHERDGNATEMDPAAVPELKDQDVVTVEVRNQNQHVAIDVAALYVDSRYGVTFMPPQPPGSNRLSAVSNSSGGGAKLAFPFAINQDPSSATYGLERLVLIAVEAVSGRDALDLSHLSQDRLKAGRGAGDDETRDLIEEALFGTRLFGSARGGDALAPTRAQAEVLSFMVVQPAKSGPSREQRD